MRGKKFFWYHTKPFCPEHKGYFVKVGSREAGALEGTYLNQQPPAAIPVHLQIFPIAEAYRSHHRVLDAEVT